MQATGTKTYKVKVYYRAFQELEILEKDYEKAHRKAYNIFMDSSPQKTLESSKVDYSLVETSISGPEASDMLHD